MLGKVFLSQRIVCGESEKVICGKLKWRKNHGKEQTVYKKLLNTVISYFRYQMQLSNNTQSYSLFHVTNNQPHLIGRSLPANAWHVPSSGALINSLLHLVSVASTLPPFLSHPHWRLGWAENACFFIMFRISQTLGEIVLIHCKKGTLPKFQLHRTFLRQGTPRLKITKKKRKSSNFRTF